MKQFSVCICFGLVTLLFGFASNAIPQEPVALIFDTDIGNDVDDVLALGMIHALETRGECKLLAVTITKDHVDAAPFVDAVNTFYGRGEIPIGICRNSKVTPEAGKFNSLAHTRDGDELRYPHDLLQSMDAQPAVALLRSILAKAPDQSIVIAQVGFSTNLADLLKTPGDAISPKSGRELVRDKVKLVSIMAGAFEKIRGDKGQMYDHPEYNVQQDIPSCQTLATQCEVPMIWSGFEVGLALPYPHTSILRDYRYAKHHPLAEAYIAYEPPPHNRPTWDLTSVLYAVRPDHGYFDVSEPGTVVVADTSLTTFEPKPEGKHRYLKLTNEQKIRVTEALVQLSSQPPNR
jgi:purine nucleosidase